MFTVDGMRKFHEWTHASLDLVLDHLAAMPAGAFVQPVPGFGFTTLRDQAIHIFNCEGFWLHVLCGHRYADRTANDCQTMDEVKHLKNDVKQFTDDYLARQTDDRLNSETVLHFPDGDVGRRTPALVLHHVLTHAFHHKGQIAAMCRMLGHPLGDTDLNNFR
jgi:uncharacterized damage-inducible protein DinB